jgi:hypothetical protein
MAPLTVMRETLPHCVELALNECTSLLKSVRNIQLIRDLQAASSALRLIKYELHNGPSRPKHQRAGVFTRYVIDEGNDIVIDNKMKDFIVNIEYIYKRY